MSLEVTSNPNREDELRVVEKTRGYNDQYLKNDVETLCVFDRLENGEIVAGLTGKTYWDYLEIGFLWVSEFYREQGRGSSVVQAAEDEARKRQCKRVLVDTYSFQALAFYQKLGYSEFGKLDDFQGGHSRHFLQKIL